MTARFDTSLDLFVKSLRKFFSDRTLSASVFLRDGVGQLSVALAEEVEPSFLEKATREVISELGGYARSSVIRSPESPSGRALLDAGSTALRVEIDGTPIRLIDRRIVGSDWSTTSNPKISTVPRIAFTSLKGGVGRSTALCVAAIHLSLRGLRVLAVDLDLEAPGIGSMLLSQEELPRFGVVDYLVENNLSGIEDDFLTDLIANSPLGGAGGRVAVLPAYGSETFVQPWNALGKLSRAYVEDVVDGKSVTVGSQIAEMLDRLEITEQFDVILIDARAGMHEISGGVFTKLGAEILMFGVDQPQTFHGYSLMIAHLQRMFGTHGHWVDRARFVHSRAIGDEADIANAGTRFSRLLAPRIEIDTNVSPPINLTIDDFELDWDDEVADVQLEDDNDTITIREDRAFRNFDPRANPLILSEEGYRPTYNEFLRAIESLANTESFDEQ